MPRCASLHSLRAQRYDAVLLQHEYGIYGGYRGEYVVELLRHAAHRLPFVTTLHTVEKVPSPMVQHALQQLLRLSVALTALSPSGCRNVESWHDTVGASGDACALCFTDCISTRHACQPGTVPTCPARRAAASALSKTAAEACAWHGKPVCHHVRWSFESAKRSRAGHQGVFRPHHP